ncbi:MAG: amino acid permease [Anaerolineaceae bacterium]|nr:amino acid permease [Anaerolineaceae bacterium]
MAKRTLKRQLNLIQVIMLGTAGTLGSGIFVLTGHAAGVAGPATILAVIIAGLLSFSIALNYSELATTYPETGGAMTYVREAWGKGLIAFLVGSMDSISSTFYCALSAVGFAYSLSVFIPGLPIVPVAIGAILVFTLLNIFGVTNIGNIQLVMGGILVFAFTVYIVGGFVSSNGFNLSTLLPDGKMFIGTGFWENLISIMRTIALIYALYVGFEVIADDAEEVKNPNKNIPVAILISLAVITLVYALTSIVALGTSPWNELAGSETALSDTIAKFLPGVGVVIIGVAGMVGALTSINSSMLSATRETFTLSRDGAWPMFLQRLNRARVPFMAIIFIGVVSSMITGIGLVNFLSYITSAGYLFVLFCSNISMIALRKKYPFIHRPYKVPLFPLTPIVASLTCLIVIAFSELNAILFMVGILALLSLYYYGRIGVQAYKEAHKHSLSPGRYRLIVPFYNTGGLDGVMKIGTVLAEAKKNLNMCLLLVVPKSAQVDQEAGEQFLDSIRAQRRAVLDKFIHYAVDRNVPMYTKMITDTSLADGIINEIKNDDNVNLLLLKWPDESLARRSYINTIQQVADAHIVNFGILHDRGIKDIKNILVPVSSGFHSRLSVRLANEIATQEGGTVEYLHIIPRGGDEEANEDQLAHLQEVVMTELNQIPANASLEVIESDDVVQAIVDESHATPYDLIMIGSSEESKTPGSVFGYKADTVAEQAGCSVLIVHHQESPAASWLRRQLKRK